MKLAALAALVMLVASCCPCRKHRKGDGKPFVGTEWQLVQLNGRAVPVEGDLFTVVFGEDGRLVFPLLSVVSIIGFFVPFLLFYCVKFLLQRNNASYILLYL